MLERASFDALGSDALIRRFAQFQFQRRRLLSLLLGVGRGEGGLRGLISMGLYIEPDRRRDSGDPQQRGGNGEADFFRKVCVG